MEASWKWTRAMTVALCLCSWITAGTVQAEQARQRQTRNAEVIVYMGSRVLTNVGVQFETTEGGLKTAASGRSGAFIVEDAPEKLTLLITYPGGQVEAGVGLEYENSQVLVYLKGGQAITQVNQLTDNKSEGPQVGLHRAAQATGASTSDSPLLGTQAAVSAKTLVGENGASTLTDLLLDDGASIQGRPATDLLVPSISSPTRQVLGGGCGAIEFTQSTSESVVSGNSVSCNAGGLHTDNHYYRAFTLSDYGLSPDFTVCAVEIGVEQAFSSAGTQPIEVLLYNTNNVANLNAGTLVGSVATTIPDQSLTLFVIPVGGVTLTGQLTVEIFTPDGQGAGNSFFIGSNPNGQTAPSYLAAADCGVPNPTPTGNLGFPNMHIVMNVHGDTGGVNPCGNGTCDVFENCLSCPADCPPCVCGNGILEPGEECDDGNTSPDDGCDANCQIEGPVNDECVDRTEIFLGATPFDTSLASDSGVPPSCGGLANDIWYNWNATYTGSLIVNTCGSGYDTVLRAFDGCSCPSGGPVSNCCTANGGIGCDDPECQAAVCAVDSFCCAVQWDSICAGEAQAMCGDLCGGGLGATLACNDDFCGLQSQITFPVVAGQCYKIQVGGFLGATGTGVITLQQPVCGNGILEPGEECDDGNNSDGDGCDANCVLEPQPNDNCADRIDIGLGSTPYCNTGATSDGPQPCGGMGSDVWFNYNATSSGSLVISTCPGAGGGSNCCSANGGIGCDDPECQAAVCAIDSFCCAVAWDGICAAEAADLCGDLCGGGGGAPYDTVIAVYDGCSCPGTPSSCCVANGGIGCDDPACQAAVCAVDSFCCAVAWDGICAGEAATLCGDLCAGAGSAIACNDDFCGLQSQVIVPVVAGNCYKIQVGGFNGAQGCAVLNLQQPDCGNGVQETGEQCDDGNTNDGDGCSSSCTVEFCDGTEDIDEASSETNCGLPTDTVNGGCNSSPNVFQNISCGQSVCGSGAFDGATRDTDWYKIVLAVPTEVTWSVTASFNSVAGIVNNFGVDSCAGVSAFLVFGTAGPGETASATACLAAGTWYLFAAPDFLSTVPCPAEYTAVVSCIENCVPPPGPCDPSNPNDCNVANATPGCGDTACCQTVCAVDPFCCDTAWDQICADEAAAMCGGGSNCCFANGGIGCDDQACEDLICGQDSFCCNVAWDGICADAANAQCAVCMGGPTPVNDDCLDRLDIGVGATDFSTVGATTDGPNPGCAFNNLFGSDIWYNFTAPCNGTAFIDTCGSGYDTVIAVYEGCDCPPVGAPIACNDDSCALQSEISFAVTAGTCYKLQVGGYNSATGSGTINIDAPTNCGPATGACCEGTTCTVVSAADCAASGGVYQGDNEPCFVDSGGAVQDHVTNPNLAIPDNNAAGVSSIINVPGTEVIADVDVDLIINHTWAGDICVTLNHGATTINLIQEVGNATAGCFVAGFGCSCDNLNIILNDEGAGGPLDSSIANCGTGAAACSTPAPGYVPIQALSAFDGMTKDGNWTLTVSDSAGADLGTLVQWSLHITTAGEQVPTCTGCAGDDDCDDGNACTTDVCNADGTCTNTAINCNDGNACNGVETCNPATGCVPGAPLNCNDGNACNGVETCNPATGCLPGTPLNCNDGNACNGVETCNPATGCVAGTPLNCNDGNACNGVETCNPATGCVAGTPLNCNDGNACNGVETCNPATGCVAGTPPNCNDGNACTNDGCDPGSGCVYTNVMCDDGDPCTADTCNPASGCVYTPECVSDADCDDGDASTADACVAGCCEHTPGVGYALDINHGKCPNKFKLANSGGDVKMYIAGSAASDVHLIDLDSIRLRLCGGSDSIPWTKEPRFKDKVTPLFTECGDCSCHKLKKDYFDDIEVKFSKPGISALIGDVPTGTLVDIEVFGTLLDGTPFTAHDCVLVKRPNSYTPE